MMSKNHQFFLVSYSPWPLILSILSFNLFFSGLIFLKYMEGYCMLISTVTLSATSFFWWMFYTGEFNLEGFNSNSLDQGVKYSMLLFIASEVFFFFSFFWSYFHFFLAPCLEISLTWPPVGVAMFDYSNIPLINTLVLLMSGVTISVSHHFILNSKMKLAQMFLFFTIILGLIFSFLQLAEYNSAFFSISDSNFGSTFFMLTGFHGTHVIIGSIFLLVSLTRFNKMSLNKMNSLSFELASWYWHFVDVVWIFLYFLLYYMSV